MGRERREISDGDVGPALLTASNGHQSKVRFTGGMLVREHGERGESSGGDVGPALLMGRGKGGQEGDELRSETTVPFQDHFSKAGRGSSS